MNRANRVIFRRRCISVARLSCAGQGQAKSRRCVVGVPDETLAYTGSLTPL